MLEQLYSLLVHISEKKHLQISLYFFWLFKDLAQIKQMCQLATYPINKNLLVNNFLILKCYMTNPNCSRWWLKHTNFELTKKYKLWVKNSISKNNFYS